MGMLLVLVPSAFASSCDLPKAFSEYFDEALNDLEATAITKIMEGLEDIGLGPLGNSLPVTSFFDVKEDLFDVVFGDQTQRASLFQFDSDFFDLSATLGSNVNSLLGGMAQLNVLQNTALLKFMTLDTRLALQLKLHRNILMLLV